MTDIETPLAAVSAQKGKVVGDENLPDAREAEVNVDSGTVAAQVVQPRERDASKVNVHETSVTLDTVITDPSSPLAVQVPDAGRGTLDLPIHGLSAPTVEAVFTEHAASVQEADNGAAPNPEASTS